MSLELKTTTNTEDTANFLASSILKQLKSGKTVLFFVTGGSSISVGSKVSKILREYPDTNLLKNLIVTLTDERYGKVGHPDSNWQQLKDRGFDIPQAKLISILIGDDRNTTVEKFNIILNTELIMSKESEYRIGLFGIGSDGHTAGILPESVAVNSENLACGYDTPTFSRITITPKMIEKLDEAVVWAQGKDKWKIVESLLSENIPIDKQPAQTLKKVPLLTIFSDYKQI
jgi:6-phosphogluconolactonase/glucosamine-6-phosphate isomerase/deaminase